MTTRENIDHGHLLLIGAGPGVGAAIVRRFGREGFRATLLARDRREAGAAGRGAARARGSASTRPLPTSPTSSSYRTKLEAIYGAEDAPRRRRLQRLDVGAGRHPHLDRRAPAHRLRRRRARRSGRCPGRRAGSARGRPGDDPLHRRRLRRQPGARAGVPLNRQGRPPCGRDVDRRGGRRRQRPRCQRHDRRPGQTGNGLRPRQHLGGCFGPRTAMLKDQWQSEYRFEGT